MAAPYKLVPWALQPLVRVLIPFATGIVFPAGNVDLLLLSSWLIFLIAIPFVYWKSRSYTARRLRSIILLLSLFLTGTFISLTNAPRKHAHYYDEISAGPGFWLARILAEPVCNDTITRCNIQLLARREGNTWLKTRSFIRARLTGNEHLQTGDLILFNGKFSTPLSAAYPGAFDLAGWLQKQGIYSMLFLNSRSYVVIPQEEFNIRRSLVSFRSNLVSRLAESGMEGNELAVASALILGARSEIDKEVMADYSGSGIIHILSVSGLHVGIIYAVIILLLKRIRFLNRTLGGTIISIVALWTYAALTGLSPSVVRAAVMYSFIGVAALSGRRISPFNSLAGSALLMLIADPWCWKQLGFQLSFAALWGIFSFQPLLKKIEQIHSRILRYILLSVGVSSAAQLSTAALGFFYYGTFPVYFFIANLVAIPLSTVLTYLGIVAIVLTGIPWLGTACVWLFDKGIALLNNFAALVAHLPGASFNSFYISLPVLLSLLATLICLSLLIQHFSKNRVYAFLTAVLISSGCAFRDTMSHCNMREVVTINDKELKHIISVRGGKCQHIIFGDTAGLGNAVEELPSGFRSTRGIKTCNDHIVFVPQRSDFRP